jgi:hypothetical protein
MDSIINLLDSNPLSCKQVLVPLNESDYRNILINSSKLIYNKIFL